MKIICWQPLLTDHQAYTYGALADRVDHLRINVWRTEDATRAAHGWQRRSGAAGEERQVPAVGWWRWARKQLNQDRDAIHLFGSPFENRRQIMVMVAACLAGRRVALISEPYSTSVTGYFATSTWKDRVKHRLRPWRYRSYGALIARRIDTVFAISPAACDVYAAMGVPADRIAPFGYFVPGPGTLPAPERSSSASLRLVFVGSLIERKGLRTAIKAVAQARAAGMEVTLDLYGAGDPTIWAGEGITYRGMLAFGDVGRELAHYDALVLPSFFDGWGVIVNEAIQAGVPVICSDAVGASAIVSAHGCGTVFHAGDPASLAKVIDEWQRDPALRTAAAQAAQRTAPLLEPTVAADYMVQTLVARGQKLPTPDAPWYQWDRGAA